MRLAGVLLATAIVVAVLVARLAGGTVDPPPPGCEGLRCANAVSAAVWDALHTVDCDDGYDLANSTCTDDLEYVNSYPPIDSVTTTPSGRIIVKLRLLERTRLFDAWTDVVSPAGIVVRTHETTRYHG